VASTSDNHVGETFKRQRLVLGGTYSGCTFEECEILAIGNGSRFFGCTFLRCATIDLDRAQDIQFVGNRLVSPATGPIMDLSNADGGTIKIVGGTVDLRGQAPGFTVNGGSRIVIRDNIVT
jgi:hypothetical protein